MVPESDASNRFITIKLTFHFLMCFKAASGLILGPLTRPKRETFAFAGRRHCKEDAHSFLFPQPINMLNLDVFL